MIKVGSLFAGIGGFEKGIEDAFGGMADTVWQVEQNSFCQKVLKKHWPNATIYDDVCTVGKHNLEPVHILCGGFPCQSISLAGKMEGLDNAEKSGLWWEMHRIISEIRPRIAILENVANVLSVGGPDVVGSLAQIGYDCEWTVIRASDFGAPHHRARWFCVAYPNSIRSNQAPIRRTAQQSVQRGEIQQGRPQKKNATNPNSIGHQKVKNKLFRFTIPRKRVWPQSSCCYIFGNASNPILSRGQTGTQSTKPMGKMGEAQDWKHGRNTSLQTNEHIKRRSNWQRCEVEPILCGVDDGVSDWMDRDTKREHNQRLKALGNAIVPKCSEWVARQVLNSGLLDDLLQEIK